jgi:thiol:disulfide interchange protein
MELERDQFVVTYTPNKVTEKDILSACENSGFPATIVDVSEANSPRPGKGSEKEFTAPAFYSEALETAKRENKPLVLDFMASWCAPCKRIVNETFVEQNVAGLLADCVLLKIDTDEYPEIAQHFKVSGLPDIRLLTPDGREIKKLNGFQTAESFSVELEELLKSSNN